MIIRSAGPTKKIIKTHLTTQLLFARNAERQNCRTEKNFYILNIGEHQVVMQYIVYHIGFERKPYWLKE